MGGLKSKRGGSGHPPFASRDAFGVDQMKENLCLAMGQVARGLL